MVLRATEFFSKEGASVCDPAAESAFFSALKMRNGTFKFTQPCRFSELERVIQPFVKERSGSLQEVLDIGVSTGVTTVEFANFLRSNGASAKVIATDLFINAHIVHAWPQLTVLADSEGWPLQYDFRGIVVRPWIRRLDYVTLAFVPRLLARWLLRARARALIAAGSSEVVQMTTRLLSNDGDILFVENDIMKRAPAFAGRFDFIRAANILNLNYFGERQINEAVANIRSYLRGPGALLLVTRTNSARRNAGTLFELLPSGTFQILKRIGGGSEIERQILRSRP